MSGFPDRTVTLSEPKCVAVYDAINKNETFHRNVAVSGLEKALADILDTANVGLDLGGGTADVACTQTYKYGDSVKLGELVPARGSMAGSHGMNRIFLEEVRHKIGDYWDALLRQMGVQECVLLDRLSAGFESIKINFRNAPTTYRVGLGALRWPASYSIPDINVIQVSLAFER